MNILVTNWCNRRECSFCFEQSVVELKAAGYRKNASSAGLLLSAEQYRHLLRLAADEWKSPRVRLLGGEPTQHPLIAQFITEALELGLDVLVVTNGVINRERRLEIARILYSELGRNLLFLVNPYLRPGQPAAEINSIRENLKWMGSAATLATTVCGGSFDLLPLAELIIEFRLNTLIRISLSHPMLEHPNAFAAREDFRMIGRALKEQGRELKQAGIRLLCDCGFVACMFAGEARKDEEAEAAIYRGLAELDDCGIFFKSVCNPLIDVEPDLQVTHCLPLASAKKIQLTPTKIRAREELAGELSSHFKRQLSAYIFDACESCGLRLSGQCVAGCMSHRLRLQRAAAI
jgi:hypothetical protein